MSPPTRPTSRRALALVLIAFAGMLAGLGAIRVERQHQVVKLGYELTEATAELRKAREQNRKLRLELSVLTAPARIERLAEGMGLAPPAPGQIRAAAGDAGRAHANAGELPGRPSR